MYVSSARFNKCYRSERKIFSSSQDGANADGETKDTYIGTLPDGTNTTDLGVREGHIHPSHSSHVCNCTILYSTL
jgi:hypothetical protein